MKSDFTFAKDDTHRFLPWHIAIMVSLAGLMLLLALSLSSWVGTHQNDYDGSISVIIPGNVKNIETKTDQVVALLQKNKATKECLKVRLKT